MLSATSTRTFGQSALRTTIFLERRFRANLVARPPALQHQVRAAGQEAERIRVYASLQGWFEPVGGAPAHGPQCYVLAENEFDRMPSPEASPSEVAKAVSYGSLDAMGRAFRDAALPAPSVVQDAVRYPG